MQMYTVVFFTPRGMNPDYNANGIIRGAMNIWAEDFAMASQMATDSVRNLGGHCVVESVTPTIRHV